MKKVAIVFLGLFIILLSKETERCLQACTLGVANGYVTVDGRPILWKVGDAHHGRRQRLVYVSGSPYVYLGIQSEGRHSIYHGLNEAGLAMANSTVKTPPGPPFSSSPPIYRYVLENCNSLDQVRNYIQQEVKAGRCYLSGCFSFTDAHGNASIFEINRSRWFLDYNSIDSDRKRQSLFGFVIRTNVFHTRKDGTDDRSIGGRYKSGIYNISGLVRLNLLCPKTIIHGECGTNIGFEFVRYGPGRPLATIAREITLNSMVIQGVAPGEDPVLTTMWVILGQPNYGIAVPAWVRVSNIPQCLSSGDMYDRAMSLFKKGEETIVQRSVFPVEAHMFDVVNNTLLPHWRANGVPSVAEMTRIEHQMANDAYSLLDCLDNRRSNNKAPKISIAAKVKKRRLKVRFKLMAEDPDGAINKIEWNFGDGQTSTKKSPRHTYDKLGTYLISCTVTDNDGVSITDWRYYTGKNRLSERINGETTISRRVKSYKTKKIW